MAMSDTAPARAPLAHAFDTDAPTLPSQALEVDWPRDHKPLPATTDAATTAERDARQGIVRSLHALNTDPQAGSGTALRAECIDCGVEVRGIHTTLHMAARPDGDGVGPLCATCWQMRANTNTLAPTHEPESDAPEADLGTRPSVAADADAETPRERRRRREPSG